MGASALPGDSRVLEEAAGIYAIKQSPFFWIIRLQSVVMILYWRQIALM